jgi:hypothetical protein
MTYIVYFFGKAFFFKERFLVNFFACKKKFFTTTSQTAYISSFPVNASSTYSTPAESTSDKIRFVSTRDALSWSSTYHPIPREISYALSHSTNMTSTPAQKPHR